MRELAGESEMARPLQQGHVYTTVATVSLALAVEEITSIE